jgi:purine-binding chemotaxis protein CheW
VKEAVRDLIQTNEAVLPSGSGVIQLCTFWLSGRLFGVSIDDVKEIYNKMHFTSIYHAPDTVRGYMNIRGQIYLVVDLRLLVGFKSKPTDSDSKVILFKPAVAEPFGVLVDKIGDVMECSIDQVEERRQGKRVNYSGTEKRSLPSDLNMGICTLKDNLLIMLNSHSILNRVHNNEQ